MATIYIGENEDIDSAIRRFKKLVDREGILKDFRKKEFFEKPSLLEHRHNREIQHKRKRKLIKVRGYRQSYGRDPKERFDKER
jgi:small subunit ribosomal protein S21